MPNDEKCLLRLPFDGYFSDYLNLKKIKQIAIDDENYVIHVTFTDGQIETFNLNNISKEEDLERSWFEFRKRIDEIDINEKCGQK